MTNALTQETFRVLQHNRGEADITIVAQGNQSVLIDPSATSAVRDFCAAMSEATQPQTAFKVELSRSTGNGICRIFNRRHCHFGMRDHARMIATRNVVDF